MDEITAALSVTFNLTAEKYVEVCFSWHLPPTA
jgi:hypothetical protein